jgi:menaquinone-dependent protoporphyrinogen oxidase
MKILLVYGTTHGQTRKVAGFLEQRWTRQGHVVQIVDAGDKAAIADPAGFDAVVVAASIHIGTYQAAVTDFARMHRAALSAKANAFVSISLAAAGADSGDAEGLRLCIARFVSVTGWTPRRVHHVAGALHYTAYHFVKRWAMKYIAYRKGGPTDTSRDHELTDWDDVARFADGFAST